MWWTRKYLVINNYKFLGPGSSGNQCSNIYRGPQEFSEIEFQNIRDYVLALDPVPILAETLHSYSQLWLWPYGYDYSISYPENYEEIVSITLFFFKNSFRLLISKGQEVSEGNCGVFNFPKKNKWIV